MTHGTVSGLEAHVAIVFRLTNQPDLEIDFVVDTGFTGALTLPPAAVQALGLPFFQEMDAKLANDAGVRVAVHIATILRNGHATEVLLLAMGRRPLLGTALLAGHELAAQFVEQGLVTIEAL